MTDLNNSPKMRRSWQMHLSTAVVLFLEASMILCINLKPHQGGAIIGLGRGYLQDRGFGWPMHFWAIEAVNIHNREVTSPPISPPADLFIGGIIDLSLAAVALLLTALISEWLISRREGHKP